VLNQAIAAELMQTLRRLGKCGPEHGPVTPLEVILASCGYLMPSVSRALSCENFDPCKTRSLCSGPSVQIVERTVIVQRFGYRESKAIPKLRRTAEFQSGPHLGATPDCHFGKATNSSIRHSKQSRSSQTVGRLDSHAHYDRTNHAQYRLIFKVYSQCRTSSSFLLLKVGRRG
jgi:hypothetical protein